MQELSWPAFGGVWVVCFAADRSWGSLWVFGLCWNVLVWAVDGWALLASNHPQFQERPIHVVLTCVGLHWPAAVASQLQPGAVSDLGFDWW